MRTVKERYYRALSDGEHQFALMLGAVMLFEDGNVLYLFDEPETHFNPKWKYDYLSLVDSVSPQTDSHILLTTHDPVLLSGLKKEQVMKFKKAEDGDVSINQAEEDLIGMGVDGILTSDIFGFVSTLDKETKNDVIEFRELALKRYNQTMNDEDRDRYVYLYKKLDGIDYAKPLFDPMYRDYLNSMENLDLYKKTSLTKRETEERRLISDAILKKLNESES